jgi:nucleoside-diphosphate-sugar epimerase
MANRRNLLIVGASGAAATRVTEQALADPGFAVTGLSRRVPDGAGDWIAADLTDAAGLRRALATRPDISHIVYASRAPFGEGGVEDVPGNLTMLRNLLDAAEASLPRFAHLHMVHGGKWYGVHIGPFRTPAREDDPRHMPPNFYYDQQDLAAARQQGKAWSWSASRPGFVLDVAPGRARNMVSTLGAYAAICRELRVPFDFPGKPGTWTALHDVTDASLLAEGVLWMLGEPRAANRAFNITNGDCFRWCDLWPYLAAQFGVECGVPRPMSMPRWMADKAPVWEAIRARHGLALPIEQVANWEFADFFLGLDYDIMLSTTAARAAGFAGFVDSWAMFARQIEGYRAARVLPPR